MLPRPLVELSLSLCIAALPRDIPDLCTALGAGLQALQVSLAMASLSLTDLTFLRVVIPKCGVDVGPKLQGIHRNTTLFRINPCIVQ